jgi:hypothetical protein
MRTLAGLAVLTAILGGCATDLPTTPPISPPSSSPTRNVPASPNATSPTPRPTATALDLPAPGGTCAADQLARGKVVSGYSFSTLNTRVAYVIWVLSNTGADCILQLPKVVALASTTGDFQAASAINQGQEQCAKNECRTVYPESFKIRTGHAFSLELRASWFDEDMLAGSGQTPPPCGGAILGVTRAEFPLASGRIDVQWETPFERVCRSGSHVGLYVGFNEPPLGAT